MPLSMVNVAMGKLPRSDEGTIAPWIKTVTTMTTIPINAIVLAFANYHSPVSVQTRTSLSWTQK